MSVSVWVTGPDQAAAEAMADEVARRLAARRVAVEVLGPHTPGIEALAGEGLECRAAFVAGMLARHDVASVVALPIPSRAARERVRSELPRMIEVYVRPARDPGAAAYEAPERAEVEVLVGETAPHAGAEIVLRTLEVLELLPRAQDRGYSEQEEREVIRRLKAFGYL